MNKRIEKKKEAQKKEALKELFELVLQVNSLNARDADEGTKLPTVMFEFSGHIGVAQVRVYKHGWTATNNPDKDFWIRTGDFCGHKFEFDYAKVNDAKAYLKSLL